MGKDLSGLRFGSVFICACRITSAQQSNIRGDRPANKAIPTFTK